MKSESLSRLVRTIFLFFVVPCQFSQDIVVGGWPENQILIPEWTYFHCTGATLTNQQHPEQTVLLYDMAKLRVAPGQWKRVATT